MMKKFIVFCLLLVSFFAHADDDQQLIDSVKNMILETLKDPDSAKFRKITVIKGTKGATVCGEINSKNSYGGYTGFKKFTKWWNSDHALIEGDDSLRDKLINLTCDPKVPVDSSQEIAK